MLLMSDILTRYASFGHVYFPVSGYYDKYGVVLTGKLVRMHQTSAAYCLEDPMGLRILEDAAP